MTQLLVLLGCLIGLSIGYALAMRFIRTAAAFVGELAEAAVALVFFGVIVPLLWVWYASRRPVWRRLSRQQTEELQAWLRVNSK